MRIPIINRFMCFENQLKETSRILMRKNYKIIYDYSNENFKDYNKNYYKIKQLIHEFPRNHIAIKLSSLNILNSVDLSYNLAHKLCKYACDNNSKVLIDAENYKIQDNIEDISNELLKEFNKEQVNVYKTYQMYRKDTYDKLIYDLNDNREYYLGIKLVRGAYYKQDFKYDILFSNIADTHENYNKGINSFCDLAKSQDKLLIASHNKESNLLGLSKNNKNIEYSQLMGMSDDLSNLLINENGVVYKYLPFGNFTDTVPYLIRRLYENPYMFLNF